MPIRESELAMCAARSAAKICNMREGETAVYTSDMGVYTGVKPLFTQLIVVFTQVCQHLWRAGVYTC